MATRRTRICEYCATANAYEALSCMACGAPLPKLAAMPVTPAAAAKKTSPVIPSKKLETARKGGEDVDKLFTNAMYAYSVVWRTVAEALAITAVGLGIGIAAGVTGAPLLGVAGGLLIGLAVGWPIKMAYLTFIMAPAGMVVGAVFGLGLWALGLPRLVVLPMIALAVMGGWLGGQRVPYARRNAWEKMRPFLGALGGFGMGILGTMIGWGLQSVVSAWLG